MYWLGFWRVLHDGSDNVSRSVSAGGRAGCLHACMQRFECASGFENLLKETASCGTGVASHVFQPDEDGLTRFGNKHNL